MKRRKETKKKRTKDKKTEVTRQYTPPIHIFGVGEGVLDLGLEAARRRAWRRGPGLGGADWISIGGCEKNENEKIQSQPPQYGEEQHKQEERNRQMRWKNLATQVQNLVDLRSRCIFF
jgi:hypothetical protein